MKRVLILALLVGFVASAGAVSAQTLTGIITGKVTDQQGGVLPGVTVTLTGRTGAQTQVTDAVGQFRFIGLAPGSYSVKAELQGFTPKEQQNIEVGISRTIDVPLALSVSGLSETVDVVASTVMLDTTTTATDNNLSKDLLFSMPIGYGNVAVGIMNFTPGVNGGAAFGGSSDSGNSLMLDGVDVRDPAGGTAWAFFNYNIVEEVQVGGLGQPAEYGGFTGAVVNSVTKSGGNRYSFLADWKFTNDSDLLTSDNTDPALVKENCTARGPLRQHPAERLHRAAGRPHREGQGVLLPERAALRGQDGSLGHEDLARRGQPAAQHEVHVPADRERQHHGLSAVRQLQPEGARRLPDPRLRGDAGPDDYPGLSGVHLERPVPQGVQFLDVPRGEMDRLLGLLRPQPGEHGPGALRRRVRHLLGRRRLLGDGRPGPQPGERGADEVRGGLWVAHVQVRRRDRTEHGQNALRLQPGVLL